MNKKRKPTILPFVAFIFLVYTLVDCSFSTTQSEMGGASPKTASSPSDIPSPAPTGTSTPAPTSTYTPTLIPTATPEPTRTPTQTPTLIGGFSGEYLLSRDPLFGYDETGKAIKMLNHGFTDRSLCSGFLRVLTSRLGDVAVEYCNLERKSLSYLVYNTVGNVVLDIDSHFHSFGGRPPLIAWSPDGSVVAFKVSEPAGQPAKIMLASRDGQTIHSLDSCQGIEGVGGILFSPVGTKIYTRLDIARHCFVNLVDGSSKIITDRRLSISNFFSDNKTVLVCLDAGIGRDMLTGLLDLETGKVTQLPPLKDKYTEGYANYFRIHELSPKEDYFLIGIYGYKGTGRYKPDGFEYYLYSVRVDEPHEFVLLGVVNHARWSVDGAWVFFDGSPVNANGETGKQDYYAVKPDGAGLQRISKNGLGLVYGVWRSSSEANE